MARHMVAGIAVLLMMCLAFGPAVAEKQGGPEPEADALWEWVTEEHPYQNWGYWPGHEGMYPGQSPHGKYLELYANKVALEAAEQGRTEMPPGSILMKLNYAEDKETLVALTPMYKVEGYNPQAGDWYWAKYKPSGEAVASGKVQSCIDCHRSVKDNDWIFTPKEGE